MLTNIIVGFVVTVVGGLFVAIVYGVFLHDRQNAIRAYLKKQHSGWLKRRYVRVFVEAVRGEARAYETRLMFHTGLLCPVGIIVSISLIAASMAEYRLDIADARLSELHAKVEESEDTKTKDIDTVIDELQAMSKDLQGDLTELTQERSDAKSRVIGAWICFALVIVWFLWLLTLRQTYVDYRSRFSYELDRFLIRIQGLATKGELAELVRLESKVHDEDSAKVYVDQMAEIAKRHSVEGLVETFLLWDTASTESEE